jgi:hypothetical protein
MEPKNSAFQSGHIRWQDVPADVAPQEREGIKIQNYMSEARRVADQRDLLAYVKYGSSKYHEKLREVERHEQDLAERRHSLLKDYPIGPSYKSLARWSVVAKLSPATAVSTASRHGLEDC